MTEKSHAPPPQPAAIAGKCPLCGRPSDAAHRPFCSARCKTIDLGRWLREDYRIESEEPPAEDDSAS
jgi:endogenous inhibitor of DNA gyrase (YacG/DUF329 family)